MCSLLKSHSIFDAYLDAAKSTKYSEYMQDVFSILPSLYSNRSPTLTLKSMFDDLGFEVKLLEHKKDKFDYETKSGFESIKSLQFNFNKINKTQKYSRFNESCQSVYTSNER